MDVIGIYKRTEDNLFLTDDERELILYESFEFFVGGQPLVYITDMKETVIEPLYSFGGANSKYGGIYRFTYNGIRYTFSLPVTKKQLEEMKQIEVKKEES